MSAWFHTVSDRRPAASLQAPAPRPRDANAVSADQPALRLRMTKRFPLRPMSAVTPLSSPFFQFSAQFVQYRAVARQ